MSAMDLLEMARRKRGEGQASECERLSERAITEALCEKSPEIAYHAATCAGRMRVGRGEPEIALDHYRQALEIAKEWLHPSYLGCAYHDLYIAASGAGLNLAARRYGGTAFDLYGSFGRNQRGIVCLTADMLQTEADLYPFCVERAEKAARGWEKVPGVSPLPLYSFNAQAELARNAATLGRHGVFQDAVNEAERIEATDLPDEEHVALTLVHLAGSALLAKNFPLALHLSERAHSMALQRREDRVATEAVAVRRCALAETADDLPS